MKISRVTGFPFHPPADKREGTIHVLGRILHAQKRCCHIFPAPAMGMVAPLPALHIYNKSTDFR
jgi:hypothetical protein